MKVLNGETVAPGIALGRVWLLGYGSLGDDDDTPRRIPSDLVEDELNRLRDALNRSRTQIEDIREKQQDRLAADELRIFDTHVAYLQDPLFVDRIEKLVLEERLEVRAAIKKVVRDYDRVFALVESEHLRQRAGDFRDVGMRVLRNLSAVDAGGDEGGVPAGRPEGRYVLAAKRLTTTDMFNLDDEQVEGILAEDGGISSHAAILARSMGIPTITGIPELVSKLADGDYVILDGSRGEVMVNPEPVMIEEYEHTAQQLRAEQPSTPATEREHTTRDGSAVRLLASCGNVGEVNLARTYGMDGVGLFRTELMFLVEQRMPSEDMLRHHYEEVARQPGDQPVHFRLLDVTHAAPVAGVDGVVERNPALGLRGVRRLLEWPELLRLQLRAILRAAVGKGPAAILVPFLSSLSELQRVKAAIVEERLALQKAGIECVDQIRIAPIIEVPAAAFVLPALLNESDFAVVAIDDLQAHLFAADRDNASVRELYDFVHPALFELLQRMASEARELEKPLVLFGEGAADPRRVPFYVGVGFRDFSIAPVRLRAMLEILQRYTVDEAAGIAEQILQAPRALDVERILVRVAE